MPAHSCVCVCVSKVVVLSPTAGSLLWFPRSGMREGRAPRHLLNIRGNNSWADLKHGHPLHLTVSLRITPAALLSRWQVPVHKPRWDRGARRAPIREPTLLVFSPPLSRWHSPAMHGNKVGGIQWFHSDNMSPCLISLNVSACCWNKFRLRGGCLSTAPLWLFYLESWRRARLQKRTLR